MGRLPPGSSSLFLASIALVAAVGLFLVYKLRRDVEAESGGPVTDADLLKDFERVFNAGEMEPEEFHRVTAALRAKMSGPVPAAPAHPIPPARPPDEAPPSDGATPLSPSSS